MTFPTNFARALAPIAIVAAAVPAQAQSGDIAKVEAHLSAVQSMTANFTQTDSKNRVARGTLQLKRPGRIRFQYQGNDILLVGNGNKLTFVDYEVGQKNSWDLNKTPLGILLSANPDIRRITTIVPQADPRILLVRARDARRPEFGTLLLAFVRNPSAPGGLLLEGWTAIDAQNKKTTIKLDNQRYNVAVPESAFSYAEPKKRR
ncbi:outer membrane lipoprotein carrier protein LolA [Sphingomonas daechungensis]|uniref:Outer membrane lipoprotein carrier protein LolA n=1 Tax=Sphingomonas daechungensis TaxID=1176646 RepID=A0ABX6T3Q4_9SPHN|nr:outer membrane lipoprotein carrier protein LolA [Sphingomonas daechungensis]QNP44169.1 outer membrane lipoprotein carrier protein LolA [Sphingomonas daechungensis]